MPNHSIRSYDYNLPDETIAKYPLKNRRDSKLLVYKNTEIKDSRFADLIEHLPDDSLLVFNNTKVIPARLHFRRNTGARIELLLISKIDGEENQWKCIVGNKAKFKETAKTRIKTGLILNAFGEQNKVDVSEQEIQAEVQKQLRMMPGQEKMVMDFYQKNPSAVASLRGTVYEEKILNLIKEKAKPNKKEISKVEAEKILKEAHNHDHDHDHGEDKKTKTKTTSEKKSSTKATKSKPETKKVSKK